MGVGSAWLRSDRIHRETLGNMMRCWHVELERGKM